MRRIVIAIFAMALTCGVIATFSSCREKVVFPSSSISLSMAYTSSGQITQSIECSLQTQNMQNLSVNDGLIEEIKGNMINALSTLRNEFYLSFLLAYSLSPNKDFKIGDNVFIGEPFYNSQADMVSFIIIYKNINVFTFFQGGGQVDKEEQTPTNFGVRFVDRVTIEGDFPFANKFVDAGGQTSTTGERYLSIYKSCFNLTLPEALCKKLDTPSFVYDYATIYPNVRSNADMVLQNGQMYHNIWICNQDNYKNTKIKLTSTVIYTGWWYLTLLVSLIVILGVVWIIVKIKNRRR